VTEVDPIASLASTYFRAWAGFTQGAIDAAQALLRMLAEPAYKESPVLIVGGTKIPVTWAVGGPLGSSAFVWEDEKTGGMSTDLIPLHVIGPEDVSFEPPSVPVPKGEAQEVSVRLTPQHKVRTGNYIGMVLVANIPVASAKAYVYGVDP
jgi:hypothetical protein